MGAAIPTDDLRTAAPSMESTASQADIIKDFTVDSCLKLNASKFEIVKISTQSHLPESVQINDSCVQISSSAKCLGVWWQQDLLAKTLDSRKHKQTQKSLFALGSLGAFQVN